MGRMHLKREWSNTILNLIHGLCIPIIQATFPFWMKWLALKYQTKLIKSKDIYKFMINEIAMLQQLNDSFFFHSTECLSQYLEGIISMNILTQFILLR